MSRSAALLQAALRRPIEDVLSRCKLSSKSPAVTTLTGMMREAAPLILAKWPACRHQARRPPAHICLPPSHHPHPSTTSAQCGATVTPPPTVTPPLSPSLSSPRSSTATSTSTRPLRQTRTPLTWCSPARLGRRTWQRSSSASRRVAPWPWL